MRRLLKLIETPTKCGEQTILSTCIVEKHPPPAGRGLPFFVPLNFQGHSGPTVANCSLYSSRIQALHGQQFHGVAMVNEAIGQAQLQ
jgi:hypothetical protein